MKITLDLTDLVAKGRLTKEEADKLAKLGAEDTGSLGSNILLGFGVIAVALGGGFLFPSALAVAVIGVILFAAGLALVVNQLTKWALFAQICMTVGALGIVGGVSWMSDGNFYVSLALAVGLMVAAFVAGSALLSALAILELAIALGSGTAYWHASYFFGVERPAITIGILAVVALALFFASLRMPSTYERVAIIAARTAILMINLAFLIGSLFGDVTLGWPASYFTIAWAVLLIGVGLWGVTANRRWVVNAAAVFGAIHFYTQWFEYLGPNPLSVLGGGILLVAFGLGLRWFNNKLHKPAQATPAAA
jgi:iron complex transport system permease protein